MISDLKYAVRQLAKAPGFTAVAVLILALGIASNTAVFTVIDTLLLRGLPVRHPEELVLVTSRNGNYANHELSYPLFKQYRDHAQSLTGVVGMYSLGRSLIVGGSGPENIVSILGSAVSGNYFSFFGVPAFLGRTLTPDDDRADAPRPVIVLGYAFWQRQFGSDPAVIGKTIQIDGAQIVIVGVAAAGFSGVVPGSDVDVWFPLELSPVLSPQSLQNFQGPSAAGTTWLSIMGRIRPGVSRKTASAELDVLYHQVLANAGISSQSEADFDVGRIDLEPGGSGYVYRDYIAPLLAILMVVVGLVLIIACANVASLLLARTAVRQREFALRTALGAGRGQVVRQILTESILLGAAGGGLGLLFAHWGASLIGGYMLPWGTGSIKFSPDGRVLAFVTAVSVATGILVGLIPALRMTRLDIIKALKEQATSVAGGSAQRLNRALVAAQIALSVCLLAGAGLFVRTLENLKKAELGFNRKNLMVVYSPFDKSDSAIRRTAVSKDLLAALDTTPGVLRSTFSWGGGGLLAGGGTGRWVNFSVPSYVPAPSEHARDTFITYVGPGFLETLGVRLVRGRGIEFADVFPAAPPVSSSDTGEVVINQSLARRYFGSEDPVGHLIHIPDDKQAAILRIKSKSYKIIGVAENVKLWNLRDDSAFEIYMPCSEMATVPTAKFAMPNGVWVELRSVNDPLSIVSAVRSTIQTVYPKMRSPLFMTMDDTIDRAVSEERMVAHISGCFSLFALLLASLGLYGVLAYNVTQRTREIGVRMALGAQPSSIVALVLRQGMALTAIGCVAGTVGAMMVAHLIASRLYGIPALDPLTFIFTIAVLFSVALLACWLPARRATKVDPMIALRAE